MNRVIVRKYLYNDELRIIITFNAIMTLYMTKKMFVIRSETEIWICNLSQAR